MLYLTVVGGTLFLVPFVNFLFGGRYVLSVFLSLLGTSVFAAAVVFAIDALFALIIRRLPARFFRPESKLFQVGRRERGFYRRIGINRWKNRVPEWGVLTSFRKNRLVSPRDSAYLARFLLESNYGVAIHLTIGLLGFLILAFPLSGKLSVGLPIALVNLFLNLLPTMILRFNTPPLRRLYRRSLKRAGREEACGRGECPAQEELLAGRFSATGSEAD